ncbi:MAG: hypothetical protein ACR2PG_00625 [Hyphomicrobiaceae bacterium]
MELLFGLLMLSAIPLVFLLVYIFDDARPKQKGDVAGGVEMPRITSVGDAKKASDLDDEKAELKDQLELLAGVPEEEELEVMPLGFFVLKFEIHKGELRALVEKELRDRIAKIDEQLRELGIDPDA